MSLRIVGGKLPCTNVERQIAANCDEGTFMNGPKTMSNCNNPMQKDATQIAAAQTIPGS